MAERDFDKNGYQEEHPKRLGWLARSGETDGIRPNEAIRRTMREAIQLGNPFIHEGDPFVVMGSCGFDGRWFPTGSFQAVEEAIGHMDIKKGEERLYSDGDEISTTFHTFTSDGIQVRHIPGEESK